MRRDKPRVLHLVRTIEIGWYERAEAPPTYFVIHIYKDLRARRHYVPVVSRRDFYDLKRNSSARAASQILEVEDTNYDSEKFARPTAAASANAILHQIRTDFEPEYRKSRPAQ
jgi:hypothetical protein